MMDFETRIDITWSFVLIFILTKSVAAQSNFEVIYEGKGGSTRYSVLTSKSALPWEAAAQLCKTIPGGAVAQVDGREEKEVAFLLLKELSVTSGIWIQKKDSESQALYNQRMKVQDIASYYTKLDDLNSRCSIVYPASDTFIITKETCDNPSGYGVLCNQHLSISRPFEDICPKLSNRPWILVWKQKAASNATKTSVTSVSLCSGKKSLTQAKCHPKKGWEKFFECDNSPKRRTKRAKQSVDSIEELMKRFNAKKKVENPVENAALSRGSYDAMETKVNFSLKVSERQRRMTESVNKEDQTTEADNRGKSPLDPAASSMGKSDNVQNLPKSSQTQEKTEPKFPTSDVTKDNVNIKIEGNDSLLDKISETLKDGVNAIANKTIKEVNSIPILSSLPDIFTDIKNTAGKLFGTSETKQPVVQGSEVIKEIKSSQLKEPIEESSKTVGSKLNKIEVKSDGKGVSSRENDFSNIGFGLNIPLAEALATPTATKGQSTSSSNPSITTSKTSKELNLEEKEGNTDKTITAEQTSSSIQSTEESKKLGNLDANVSSILAQVTIGSLPTLKEAEGITKRSETGAPSSTMSPTSYSGSIPNTTVAEGMMKVSETGAPSSAMSLTPTSGPIPSTNAEEGMMKVSETGAYSSTMASTSSSGSTQTTSVAEGTMKVSEMSSPSSPMSPTPISGPVPRINTEEGTIMKVSKTGAPSSTMPPTSTSGSMQSTSVVEGKMNVSETSASSSAMSPTPISPSIPSTNAEGMMKVSETGAPSSTMPPTSTSGSITTTQAKEGKITLSETEASSSTMPPTSTSGSITTTEVKEGKMTEAPSSTMTSTMPITKKIDGTMKVSETEAPKPSTSSGSLATTKAAEQPKEVAKTTTFTSTDTTSSKMIITMKINETGVPNPPNLRNIPFTMEAVNVASSTGAAETSPTPTITGNMTEIPQSRTATTQSLNTIGFPTDAGTTLKLQNDLRTTATPPQIGKSALIRFLLKSLFTE